MLTSRSKIHIDSGAFVSSLEVSWGKWWKSCFSHFRIAGKVGNESHCKPSQVRCWRLPLCALMAPEIKQKNKKKQLEVLEIFVCHQFCQHKKLTHSNIKCNNVITAFQYQSTGKIYKQSLVFLIKRVLMEKVLLKEKKSLTRTQ